MGTHSNSPCIIITNADDFGLSVQENEAILAGFAEGVISSATLMANMPAFEQACRAARVQRLDDRLGLHFNLSYGAPLSQPIRGLSRLCNAQGEFDFSLPRHCLYLPRSIRQAIRVELNAQWNACVEQGVQPTHIDSHQHVHNLLPIAAIVADFAAEKAVPVRLARNFGKNISPGKAAFKWLVNRRLRQGTGELVSHACTPRDLLDVRCPGGIVEVICHPELLPGGQTGDAYLPAGKSLREVLDSACPSRQQVGYGFFIQ